MSLVIFEQSIQINASASVVEHCISDRTLMHRWLNPPCVANQWGLTDLGSRSRFVIQIPVLKPT